MRRLAQVSVIAELIDTADERTRRCCPKLVIVDATGQRLDITPGRADLETAIMKGQQRLLDRFGQS